MRSIRNVWHTGVFLFLAAALTIGAIVVFQIAPQSGEPLSFLTSSPECAPTPQSGNTGISSPTPSLSQLGTPPPTVPTITPLPIISTTDLAPELADEDKTYVYVYRCEGTFELFLIGPVGPNAVISDAIPLRPGDIIYNAIPPASLVGHEPPTAIILSPTASMESTSTAVLPTEAGIPTAYPGGPTLTAVPASPEVMPTQAQIPAATLPPTPAP